MICWRATSTLLPRIAALRRSAALLEMVPATSYQSSGLSNGVRRIEPTVFAAPCCAFLFIARLVLRHDCMAGWLGGLPKLRFKGLSAQIVRLMRTERC